MAVLIRQNKTHGEEGSLDGEIKTLSGLLNSRQLLRGQLSLLLGLGVLGRVPEVGNVLRAGRSRNLGKIGDLETHGKERSLDGQVQSLLSNLGVRGGGGLAQLLVDSSVSGRQVVLGLSSSGSDNLGGRGPVQSDQLCGSQAGERKSSEFH